MAYVMNYQQYEKYNTSGIYSISIIYGDNDARKILYVGQSKNMYKRILQHVREITKDWSNERKYQLLHNFWLKTCEDPTKRIQFDVLEYCAVEDLDQIEQAYIDYLRPVLNTVGMNDNKKIDERIADNEEIFWLLELPGSWFCFE